MKKFTIKNRIQEGLLFRRRLWIMCLCIFILMLLLVSRLVYLQIFQHQYYTTLSKKNDITLVPIPPKRGLIFDRNKALLAKNIPVFNLMVTPQKTLHLMKELKNIASLMPISPHNFKAFSVEKKHRRPFEPLLLKPKLTPQQVAIFAVNRFHFPGFAVEAQLVRYYPQAQVAAHTVGYVGRINAMELQQLSPSNYAATSYTGKTGVEKYFEPQLHGQVGYKEVETNASGQTIRPLTTVPAIAGENLYLTLDADLQAQAEKALHGFRGALVAIQPDTGEILALVSTPGFNPNIFIAGISRKKYRLLQNSSDHPLYDRTIRGLYAPGSTIKPFIALAGLNAGVITPTYKIFDPGWFRLPNTKHKYHNWMRTGFGWVNLHDAIMRSDDTYFYNLATLLGISKIDNMLLNFGFGQPTGIQMAGELAGVVPSPAYKSRLTGQSWFTGDTVITGIGQGFLQTTPLQLASATATLAERGRRMQLRLIKAVQQPGQKPVLSPLKELPPVIADKPQYWSEIIRAMQSVINNPNGTGFRFGKPSYTVAAKTGTAQVYTKKHDSQQPIPERERDNSLFIAFAPVKNPKIAVAAVVENDVSAPVIARKVMDYYLLTQHHLAHTKETPHNDTIPQSS
jgi:penicillin-binding protein 2